MIFCKECGTQLEIGENFCGGCGVPSNGYLTTANKLDLDAKIIELTNEINEKMKLSRNKHNQDSLYAQRGYVYIEKGKYDLAINDFSIALQLDLGFSLNKYKGPFTAYCYIGLGEAYIKKGEFKKGLAEYKNALKNPFSVKGGVYARMGLAYFLMGDYIKARAELEKSLHDDSAEYNLTNELAEKLGIQDQSNIANILRKKYYIKEFRDGGCQENHDIAITNFTNVIQYDSNWPSVFLARGLRYLEKGDYDNAVSDFNIEIQRLPAGINDYDRFEVYCGRGKAYLMKHDYDNAISDYNEAIHFLSFDNNYNYHYEVHCERGIAYLLKGDITQANVDFEKSAQRASEYNYTLELSEHKKDLLNKLQAKVNQAEQKETYQPNATDIPTNITEATSNSDIPDPTEKPDNIKLCTNCNKKIQKDWLVCPFCKTEIATEPLSCATCEKELDPEWAACPYCKTRVAIAPPSCAACGKKLDPDWAICPYCQTEV